jgi:uncharacterized membrane protein
VRYEHAVDVAAPAATVWEVVRDVERWPALTESMTRVEVVGGGPLSLGSRVRVKQPRLPVAQWEVTELAEGEAFSWVAHAPGFTTVARHAVVARADGASRLVLSIEMGGPLGRLFGALTAGRTRRYVAMEAAGIKDASEARAGA